MILSVYLDHTDAKGITGTRTLVSVSFCVSQNFSVRLISQTQFYQLSLIPSQLCGHPGAFSVQTSSKGNWMGVAPVRADSSRNGEGTGKQTGSCLGEGRPRGSQCEVVSREGDNRAGKPAGSRREKIAFLWAFKGEDKL